MGEPLTHVTERFKSLAPEVRRALAKRFDLLLPEDDNDDMAYQWLLRARQKGVLQELEKTIIEASPGIQM